MEKITQIKIAKETKASCSSLSEILSGKKPIGKKTAQKFSNLTGRRWIEYLDMPPEEIRADLESALQVNDHAS